MGVYSGEGMEPNEFQQDGGEKDGEVHEGSIAPGRVFWGVLGENRPCFTRGNVIDRWLRFYGSWEAVD